MKLSEEQKEYLINELSMPHGWVKLLCDGYVVDLSVVKRGFKSVNSCVQIHVDGFFYGFWAEGENYFPQQKFLKKTVQKKFSFKEIAELAKLVGLRNAKKRNSEVVHYSHFFPSGSYAINHLCSVCESIQDLHAPDQEDEDEIN